MRRDALDNSPLALGTLALAALLLGGCFSGRQQCLIPDDLVHYQHLASAESAAPPAEPLDVSLHTDAPPLFLSDALRQGKLPPFWDLRLDEVVQMALGNARVLRDLGATVLRAPGAAETVYSPALVATDPRFGMEGALASFDAQLATQLLFNKNDRAFNNRFFGGGTFNLRQDLADFSTEISKQTATGARFAVRHLVDYDGNNAPQNQFPTAWQANLEGEFRMPLLQGAGVEFNRIAGPQGSPGVYNGVLVARANADVSVADFEIGLRDFVSNVENAYWDLYFAYRDFEARVAARDHALATWQVIKARFDNQRKGGEADKEAQAREQYFRFQEEVLNALVGRPVERTRTNNGSGGGTFRGVGGVYAAERRLRLLVGLPVNDGRLARPVDDPLAAPLSFDWSVLVQEGMLRRPELRRQRAQVERAALELTAARNFLLPRLDTVGRYRWRGFGDDLIDPNSDGAGRFDNAYANLTSGDFQEWELGMELNVPIGFRREYAAVRNAQLQVARQRTLLVEQERQVTHDLSAALSELDRAWTVTQTALFRRQAAGDELRAATAAYENDRVSLEVLLDAQGRLAEAQSNYARALLEYAVALKNIHFEKGSLLDYHGIALAGACGSGFVSQSPADRPLNYALANPPLPKPAAPVAQLSGEKASAELAARERDKARRDPPPQLPPLPPTAPPNAPAAAPAPAPSAAPPTANRPAAYQSYYEDDWAEKLPPGAERLPHPASESK